jgi:hypothetical protein
MRYPYRNRCFIPLISAALLSIGVMTAPMVMASETTPCLEEIEKYCNHVTPGEGTLKCLQEHDNDLSTTCREKLVANNRKILNVQQHCAGDIGTFCRGVVPESARILKCLSGHRDELAPDCREIITAWKEPGSETGKPVDKPEMKPMEPPEKRPLNNVPVAPTTK